MLKYTCGTASVTEKYECEYHGRLGYGERKASSFSPKIQEEGKNIMMHISHGGLDDTDSTSAIDQIRTLWFQVSPTSATMPREVI